jgi:hypothetical protein
VPYIIVRNRVESYTAWKRSWDAGAAIRRNGGIVSEQLFRNPGITDEVLVLVEFSTLEQARTYLASAELQEVLRESGIKDRSVYFPTDV